MSTIALGGTIGYCLAGRPWATNPRSPICFTPIRHSLKPCHSPCPIRKSCHARDFQRMHAFRPGQKVQDWRIQQMMDHATRYFSSFLNKGQESIAEELFDDEIVHKDVVWDPAHPTAGVVGMRHYLHDLRAAFPDFSVVVEEMAPCDMNSLMVKYSGTATGLGEYHGQKPTHHSSTFSGINLFRFNHERSKIVEILVYRSAFAEDRLELGESVLHGEGGFRELRLRRLV